MIRRFNLSLPPVPSPRTDKVPRWTVTIGRQTYDAIHEGCIRYPLVTNLNMLIDVGPVSEMRSRVSGLLYDLVKYLRPAFIGYPIGFSY